MILKGQTILDQHKILHDYFKNNKFIKNLQIQNFKINQQNYECLSIILDSFYENSLLSLSLHGIGIDDQLFAKLQNLISLNEFLLYLDLSHNQITYKSIQNILNVIQITPQTQRSKSVV